MQDYQQAKQIGESFLNQFFTPGTVNILINYRT